MQKVTSNSERTIRSVCASMKMEGFHVSKQTQEDCRAILSGQKSADGAPQSSESAHSACAASVFGLVCTCERWR